jgi:hypothetical protein
MFRVDLDTQGMSGMQFTAAMIHSTISGRLPEIEDKRALVGVEVQFKRIDV